MEKEVGSLEEEALKRKQRLLSLKRRREGEEENNTKATPQQELPKPKFRSYKPQDSNLSENAMPAIKPGDIHTEVKDQLEAAKSKVVIDELDITNLAPRKPDWDLKRDVAKRLEKLERRTQRAIAELIRDRLKSQADLASIATSNEQ